jgi:DNA-binding response OmpR family regulator
MPAEGDGTFFYVLQDAMRILYVDDDPILREFAQVHLTTESATIETAEDGLAGLDMLAACKPDLVVLDLEMPRLDGFEMLQRMRADPAHERTPVIVATGREDVAAIDRAFHAGATSFTIKPVNWRLLSYQIRYVHRAHQTERSLLEARRRARAETEALTGQLTDLAAASSRFIARALDVQPQLRAAAADYLTILETASRPARRAG